MKKYLTLIIIFYAFQTHANDAYLCSIGGNVFPIFGNNSIRMLKENINIKMGRDSCFVKCNFWFVNNSNQSVSILMGFPDYLSDPASESQPLRSFTCKVDGVDQSVDKFISQLSVDNDENVVWYEKWYGWLVSFQPYDTLAIENTYWGSYGGSLSGTYSFDYLIGTAKTWNGTIGDGSIIFNYSDIISDLFIDTSYYKSDKALPQGLSRIICTDSLIYSFIDYAPEWDQRLRIEFFPFWTYSYGNERHLPKSYYRINRTKEQYQRMIDEIYARKGYAFNDRTKQEYFQKQTWYRKDPDFSEFKLNDYELFFIDILKELKNK